MFKQIFKNSICIFVVLSTGCQNSGDSSTQIVVSNSNTEIKTSYSNDILGQYLRIKDALITSDMSKTNIAAEGLKNVLDNEIQKEGTINLRIGGLKKITLNIIDAKDIQMKRKSFFELSQLIYEALQNESILSNKDTSIYIQYCPMAFNNSGGIWLSLEHDISNPFFGDMMLNCGVGRDTK